MLRHGRTRGRDDRGAAAVEFALILTPLLFIVFGIIQYGWYFNSTQSGTSAAADAARRLSVGDCQDSSQLRTMLASRLGGAMVAGTVSASVTYTNSAGATIVAPGAVGGNVAVRLQFQSADFHLPFIPFPDGGTIVRTAMARVEDTNASTVGCR